MEMAQTPRNQHYRPPPSGSKGRDFVSPLGGQSTPFVSNLQKVQEERNRAQTRRPREPSPRAK
jgi:hypothetical protein